MFKTGSGYTRLGVNVDHVATIRQARGGQSPDPVEAAVLAELAGCDGITIHLREDRRHIQDRDLAILKRTTKTRINLEMAATQDMVKIALDVSPHTVTLVPERREVTSRIPMTMAIRTLTKATTPSSIQTRSPGLVAVSFRLTCSTILLGEVTTSGVAVPVAESPKKVFGSTPNSTSPMC